LGKLVYQLIKIVTFAYDPHFRRMIARWKGLSKDYTCFSWRALQILIVVSPKNIV